MDASECGRLVVELVKAVSGEASRMRAEDAGRLLAAVGGVLRRGLRRAERSRAGREADGRERR